MLPVRVKVISSSTCSLSGASELLKRFLTSDLSSNSYAKSYVKSVVLALDEALSKRSGILIANADRTDGKERTWRHSISSCDSELGSGNRLETAGSSAHKSRKWKHSTKISDITLGGRSSPNSLLEHAFPDVTVACDSGGQLLRARDELQRVAPESTSKKHKKQKRHSTITPSEERLALAFEDADERRSEVKRTRQEMKEKDAVGRSNVLSSEMNIVGGAAGNSSDPRLPREHQELTSEKKKKRKKRRHSDSRSQILSE